MARSTTTAVDKAFDLVETIARSDRPLRLTELSERLGMHRATAYRVLVDLVRRGWVMRSGDAYLPGTAVLQISRVAAANTLVAVCRPVLVDLAERTGMMTNLQVLEPDGSRILDVIRPGRYALIAELAGELLPVHRFAGPLALVAGLDERMAEHYLALAERDGYPLDGPGGLRAELETTRDLGYAVVRRRSQAVIASVSQVVPAAGPAPAALTVVGLDTEFDDETLAAVVRELAAAVSEAAALLDPAPSGPPTRAAGRADSSTTTARVVGDAGATVPTGTETT